VEVDHYVTNLVASSLSAKQVRIALKSSAKYEEIQFQCVCVRKCVCESVGYKYAGHWHLCRRICSLEKRE
jgi:hypothetical protein